MDTLAAIHSAGEEAMAFETPAGKVFLEAGEEPMTPCSGFVPWAAFLRKAGVLETLATICPIARTSPNASRCYDVLCRFMLTCACDGDRFQHVNRLRHGANALRASAGGRSGRQPAPARAPQPPADGWGLSSSKSGSLSGSASASTSDLNCP